MSDVSSEEQQKQSTQIADVAWFGQTRRCRCPVVKRTTQSDLGSFCLCKDLEPMPVSLIPYAAMSTLSTASKQCRVYVCVYKPDIDEKLPLVQRLAELVC